MTPPGDDELFRRYEMTYVSPYYQTYYHHNMVDESSSSSGSSSSHFHGLPAYVQLRVNDHGCGKEVVVEQYWQYGGSGSSGSNAGPMVVGAIEGVMLDVVTEQLVISFCYLQLEGGGEGEPPPPPPPPPPDPLSSHHHGQSRPLPHKVTYPLGR